MLEHIQPRNRNLESAPDHPSWALLDNIELQSMMNSCPRKLIYAASLRSAAKYTDKKAGKSPKVCTARRHNPVPIARFPLLFGRLENQMCVNKIFIWYSKDYFNGFFGACRCSCSTD